MLRVVAVAFCAYHQFSTFGGKQANDKNRHLSNVHDLHDVRSGVGDIEIPSKDFQNSSLQAYF